MKRQTIRGALAGLVALGAVGAVGACKSERQAAQNLATQTTPGNPTGPGTGTPTGAAPGTVQEHNNTVGAAPMDRGGATAQNTPGTTGAPTGSAPGSVTGNNPRMGNAEGTPTGMRDAREVLRQLHHDNQMEIQMGQLAQRNGQARAVKEFGAMLVRDHQAADRRVLAVAKSKNFMLGDDTTGGGSPKADAESQQHMEKMRGLKGAEFDRHFASMMTADHEKTITLVKTAQNDVEDAEVKALLTELLPKLEQHRERAQSLTGASAAGEAEGAAQEAQGRRPAPRR